jgi:hypothetical protein
MIHIEEVEKVQHLIEPESVSLNIFQTAGILGNHRTDDGKDCKENEEKDRELEGSKKVKQNGKKATFTWSDGFIQFFHKDVFSI